MKAIKSLILRYPAAASVVLFGLFFALSEIELDGLLMPFLNYQKASYLSGTIVQGGLSVLMVMLIAWLGMKREAGFTPVREWKALWLIWPVLVFSALNGLEVIDGTFNVNWADGGLMALFTLLYLSVGFIEEILFRGLILPLMLRQWGTTRGGVYKAVHHFQRHLRTGASGQPGDGPARPADHRHADPVRHLLRRVLRGLFPAQQVHLAGDLRALPV